jgi:hypothetical protein
MTTLSEQGGAAMKGNLPMSRRVVEKLSGYERSALTLKTSSVAQ